MKASRLIQILLVLVPARKPVMIKGKPGVGKTSIVEEVARQLSMDLVVWHPITWDPVDAKGFPSLDAKNKVAEFLPYGDLERIINADVPTICFIDDMGQATPAVQAAVMHPILARSINGHKISDNVTFVIATNRREDNAAVSGLISPLVDRMVAVFQLDADVDDTISWGLRKGMPPVLLAFLKTRPQYLTDYKTSKDLVKMTSPRTLYEVGELMKLGLGDDLDVLTAAAGETFATEFLAFARTFGDLPDRDEIIMNPTSAPIPAADRPDLLLALMGALAYVATPANFDSIVTYLDRVAAERQSPEYGVCCIKNATSRDRKLIATAAYIRFTTKYQELYGLAGVAK